MSGVLSSLARPWWLLALLPLALLAWRLGRASDAGAATWTRLVDAHLLPHLLVDAAPRARRLGIAALVAALALAILAAAGPQRTGQSAQAYRRDALRVLVVDLSPSMASALDGAKAKLLALLRALPEGETALLVYADEPYLVVPPTTDAQTIARFIPELAVDAMPAPGNRPERALAMTAQLLARNAAATRDIVWVSAAGIPSHSAIEGLQDARLTLLRPDADDSDLRLLQQTLERGGRLAAEEQATSGAADVGYLLLPLLLPLAALPFRRGLLMLAVPLLCAGLPPPAEANALADYLGARRLRAGDHEAAARTFDDPAWRAVAHYRAGRYEDAARLLAGRDDHDSHYNRGNALARQGRLADALAAYDAALKSRPDDADTLHNRDLVRRLLSQRNREGRAEAPASQSEHEAARVAEQWLSGVPNQPESLLRRKLAIEHLRRSSGAAEKPW